nr:uncharacterized protein LOC119173729 [Rhipicephalus microplus]
MCAVWNGWPASNGEVTVIITCSDARWQGVFFRKAYSVPEQCGKNPAEHYQGEDWEKEYALPDGSTAEGRGDDKIPKNKEQKRVHWEEDDRLVTVHTLPSQSSSPMKVVPESHQKEDQHEGKFFFMFHGDLNAKH